MADAISTSAPNDAATSITPLGRPKPIISPPAITPNGITDAAAKRGRCQQAVSGRDELAKPFGRAVGDPGGVADHLGERPGLVPRRQPEPKSG